MNEFKEAWCIELYDALCLIQGHADASGTSDMGEIGGYTIAGKDISALLEHLPQIAVDEATQYNPKHEKSYRVRLDDRTFNLNRRLRLYGDSEFGDALKIERIEAMIETGPDLLQIKVHVSNGESAWTDYLTYSGRFLVHWATPENNGH